MSVLMLVFGSVLVLMLELGLGLVWCWCWCFVGDFAGVGGVGVDDGSAVDVVVGVDVGCFLWFWYRCCWC